MRYLELSVMALALLLAPGGAVRAGDVVVGNDGALYRVEAGLYGDLFPEGTVTDVTDTVLALDTTSEDGETTRALVAATVGPGTEKLAALVFEDASETLYLAWEEVHEGASRFLLAGRQAETWLPSIEFAHDVDPQPGSLRIGVTRDTYLEVAQGNPDGAVERTVLHLAWWDRSGSAQVADSRVLYAPVVLLNGAYLGSTPIVALNGLDPYDGTETFEIAESARVPTLERGRDTSSVVVAFPNPASGQVIAVEARALPGELGRVAREVADIVLDEGTRTLNVQELGDILRGHIVEFSTDMHPAYRDYLGNRVKDRWTELIYSPERPGVVIQEVADQLRRDIVDLGSTFYGADGRSRFFDPQRLRFVEIYSEPLAAGDVPAEMPHLVRLYLVKERLTPIEATSEAEVVVSEDGDDSLLIWAEEGALRYQQSSGDEWGEVRTLPLSEDVNPELGRKVLRERIRGH